jgi:hypothetical protein
MSTSQTSLSDNSFNSNILNNILAIQKIIEYNINNLIYIIKNYPHNYNAHNLMLQYLLDYSESNIDKHELYMKLALLYSSIYEKEYEYIHDIMESE